MGSQCLQESLKTFKTKDWYRNALNVIQRKKSFLVQDGL